MKQIELTQGKLALVDDEDFERLNQWKWYADNKKHTFYAVRSIWIKGGGGKKKTLPMQYAIIDCPENKIIDHINSNGLDNRKENLRICTYAENGHNKKSGYGSSKFKGVCLRKGDLHKGKRYKSKYMAYITRKGTAKYLGLFDDEISAAKARDKEAVKLYGEFASLNFPDNDKCPDCDGSGTICLGYDDNGYAVLEQCRWCYEQNRPELRKKP